MLAWAESKEEVLRALKEDVYSKSGVWNWDKVQIHPVRTFQALEWYFECSRLMALVIKKFKSAFLKP